MIRASILPFMAVLLLAASGCNKKYDPPLPLLPGAWQQAERVTPTTGASYRIKFAADSTFRLYRRLLTDAIDLQNPCNNSRTQYIQGTWELGNDRLRLHGLFFDSSYAIQTPDCTGATTFNVQHSIRGEGKNLILDDEGGLPTRITLVPVDSL